MGDVVADLKELLAHVQKAGDDESAEIDIQRAIDTIAALRANGPIGDNP